MTARTVSGIINQGGTILRTGRCPELKTEVGRKKAIKILNDLNIDSLVIIGGDGSLAAGEALSKEGVKVINLPATIDNDVVGTEETIGYDTALNTAVDAIDKIRDTAQSHDRIFVVEIMGRHHGFLTLAVGLASGAEVIIVPVLLTAVGGGQALPLTKAFIALVLKEDRENMIQFMANSYVTLYRKQKNVIRGKLTTAARVSAQTEQKMRQMVESKTNGTVEFETEVNPDIIGGFILEYDTYRMDASVKSKLNTILNQLSK